MKKGYRFLFFLIGVVGLAFLVIRLDPEEKDFKEVLQPKTLLFLAAMLLLWVLIYAVHTQAFFRIIGPDKKKIRWISLYRIIISGFALNNLTPFGLAGGEPYRIMELKPRLGAARAVSATLSFSMLFIIGHVLLWITGILLYVLFGCPGETWITVLLLLTGAVFITLSALFFLKRKGGLVVPVFRFLSRLPLIGKTMKGLLEKNQAHYDEIDESYVEFKNRKADFAAAAVMEYAARILEGMEYFLIFLYVGESVNLFGGILILSMASLIGNLFFMIPMQAGSREGGMIMALRWLNVDAGAGIPGGLLYRVRDILCSVIGILCILIERKHEEKLQNGAPE